MIDFWTSLGQIFGLPSTFRRVAATDTNMDHTVRLGERGSGERLSYPSPTLDVLNGVPRRLDML